MSKEATVSSVSVTRSTSHIAERGKPSTQTHSLMSQEMKSLHGPTTYGGIVVRNVFISNNADDQVNASP